MQHQKVQIQPGREIDYSGLMQEEEKKSKEGGGADMDIVKMLMDLLSPKGGDGQSDLLGTKGISALPGSIFEQGSGSQSMGTGGLLSKGKSGLSSGGGLGGFGGIQGFKGMSGFGKGF